MTKLSGRPLAATMRSRATSRQSGPMAGAWTVMPTRHLAPVGADGGRVGITVERGVDFGHHQFIGQRQGLGVDLRAADDPDLPIVLAFL